MNENYLRYFFTASGTTMNYPLWTTIGGTFYDQADLVIPVKKEISFIKKEIPKFELQSISKVLTVNLENIRCNHRIYHQTDIERVLSSLNPIAPQYHFFDEFH